MSWPRRNKYNAQKTRGMDGDYYPSKCEAAVADICYLMRLAGEIEDYAKQVQIQITDETKWKVDFGLIMPGGAECYVEAKGFETDLYRKKRALYIKSDFKQKLPLFIYGHQKVRGRGGYEVYLKEAAWSDGMAPPF